MESSADRKARLVALRDAASAYAASGAGESHPPQAPPPAQPYPPPPLHAQLPDPLPPAVEQPPGPPRFDYYTNPGSAYSGHKRKSFDREPHGGFPPYPSYSTPPAPHYHSAPMNYSDNTSHPRQHFHQHQPAPYPDYAPYQMPPPASQPAPYQMPPPPPVNQPISSWRAPYQMPPPTKHQYPPAQFPEPSQYQMPPPRQPRSPWRSPPQFPPHGQSIGAPPTHYPHPRPEYPEYPDHTQHARQLINQWGNPSQYQPPMAGHYGARSTSPSSWHSSGGPHSQGPYLNSPAYGWPGHHFTQGDNRMVDSGPRDGPNSYPGRGRGPFGRGGRSGNNFSRKKKGLHNFKGMVENPWFNLQPVVGNLLDTIGAPDPDDWLPPSVRKKAILLRQSGKEQNLTQEGKKANSGLSLAEYLDLSMKEAEAATETKDAGVDRSPDEPVDET